MASPQDVIKMVKENDVKFVDFRFTDTRGKEQHVSVPVGAFSISTTSEVCEDKMRHASAATAGTCPFPAAPSLSA